MSLVVQEEFVEKYRHQYYKGNLSVEELKKQQKQLFRILDDLYYKVNHYFNKVCFDAQKKSYSHRTSLNKQNIHQLPSLVAEAQLKNSQTYRQILQNQKNKLQKRMLVTVSLVEKNINKQIKSKKQKLSLINKENKHQKLQIKKLGQKLVEQQNTVVQTYQQLYTLLKQKKAQNCSKVQKINENNAKIEKLKQKNLQLQQRQQDVYMNNSYVQELQEEESEKLVKKLRRLQDNRQKIKQNIQSFKLRMSQQYFFKLKQLQAIIKKTEAIEENLQDMQQKLLLKNDEMSKSIFI